MTLARDGLTLLHNPRCSKSRQAKQLLEDRGVPYEERLYLDAPLDREELEDLASRLGRPIGEWVRRKDAAFSEAGLDEASDAERLFDAVAVAPILMERPILVGGTLAKVGRPPEDILELLD